LAGFQKVKDNLRKALSYFHSFSDGSVKEYQQYCFSSPPEGILVFKLISLSEKIPFFKRLIIS